MIDIYRPERDQRDACEELIETLEDMRRGRIRMVRDRSSSPLRNS